jgi:3-hydroxyacyl-[acyl-carrier-protein] dehydratase
MRYLHVDRITSLEPDRACGVKCVTLSDDALTEHFTGWPIYPGALLLEAMAQLAGAMLDEEGARNDGNALAVFVGVDRLRLRRQVVPGDRLALEARLEKRLEDGARVQVSATSDDAPVADGLLLFAISRDMPPAFVAERARIRALMQHGRWYR